MDTNFATKFGETLLVVNPTSNTGVAKKAGEKAEAYLGARLGDKLTCIYTEYADHAKNLAAHSKGYDTIIALGGDGIIHEVVNGLMELAFEDRPRFGILPCGCGNDYAKTVHMNTKIETSLAQLDTVRKDCFDVGKCNDEYFAETLSFGLDAAIAIQTTELRKTTGKRGISLYFKAGIDQLLHHLDTFHLEATFDEKPFSGDMKMLAVQIGKTYGGGFIVCPEASPKDGILDTCMCSSNISVPRAVYIFAKAKDGHHTKYKELTFRRATHLTLSFDRHPPTQLDGEECMGTEFDITIAKQVLPVWVGEE